MNEEKIIENGMIIRRIQISNLKDYSDILPIEVAENIERVHYRGVALHVKAGEPPVAAMVGAATGYGWDSDKSEIRIDWAMAESDEHFLILIKHIKVLCKEYNVSGMYMKLPADEKAISSHLKFSGFLISEKEDENVEITEEELLNSRAMGKDGPVSVIPLSELTVREFRRGLTYLIFRGARGLLDDAEFLPMSWFDENCSCCVKNGNTITGMLLVKRGGAGTLMPLLFFALEPDSKIHLLSMISYFTRQVVNDDNEGDSVIICRYNAVIKALVDKFFPGKKGERVKMYTLKF